MTVPLESVTQIVPTKLRSNPLTLFRLMISPVGDAHEGAAGEALLRFIQPQPQQVRSALRLGVHLAAGSVDAVELAWLQRSHLLPLKARKHGGLLRRKALDKLVDFIGDLVRHHDDFWLGAFRFQLDFDFHTIP